MSELLMQDLAATDVCYWANKYKIKLQTGEFNCWPHHAFQEQPMNYKGRRLCYKKARQSFGATTIEGLKDLHGMRYGKYKLGVLHSFPTRDEVDDFGKSYFKPLIANNRDTIGKYVRDTDTAYLKKVCNAFLYLRGATLSQKLGDTDEDTSSKTAGFSVDRVVFDEIDFMDSTIIEKFKGAMGHSLVKEEVYLGNPSHEDYGIDAIFCVVPETKILTTDLRWIRADELKNGDSVVGFDEEKLPENKTRRYRSTKITDWQRIKLHCLKIYLDDGNTVTVSKEHKWLTEKSTNVRWKMTKKLKVGDKLFSIGMWDEGKTKEAGWVSGFYDGEGYIGICKKDKKGHWKTGHGQETSIGLSQNAGSVLEYFEKTLKNRGFSFYKDSSKKCVQLRIKGGLPEKLRLLGTFRPIRLLQKAALLWENISVGNDCGNTQKPKVLKIEDVGIKDVIALGTEHKTFIANGLLSHNSQSDQRYWFRRCGCGVWTCAEKSFPNCVKIRSNGSGYVGCDKCGKELPIWAGAGTAGWVADFPANSNYMVGYHLSKLTNIFCDPAEVLRDFENPPNDNLADVYRLQLGRAYSPQKDKLRKDTVLACCGRDIMSISHAGPCAMGVDVGIIKHVVIGVRTGRDAKGNDRYEVVKVARCADFNEIHDLTKKFNVKSGMLDIRPYQDEVRQFQKGHGDIRVYLGDYRDSLMQETIYNENTKTVLIDKTNIFDATHRLISRGQLRLPAQCPEIEQFAIQCCNCAKFEEKKKNKPPVFRYRPTGDRKIGEHYRSALNYFLLAAGSNKIGIVKGNSFGVTCEPQFVVNDNSRYI